MSFGETDIEDPQEAATQSARVANNADDHRARFKVLRDRIEALHDQQPWGTDDAGQQMETEYLGQIDAVFDFAMGNAENIVDLATNAGMGALLSDAADEEVEGQLDGIVSSVDETMGQLQTFLDGAGGGGPGHPLDPAAAQAALHLNQLARDSGVAEALGDERVAEIDDFVDEFFGPSAA